MRLIDEDLLKKNIAKWLNGSDPQETVMVKLDDISVSVIMEIEEQPTAYDVEKVVKQLEEVRTNYFLTIANTGSEKLDIAYGCVSDSINKAIDIVKKGGVRE